MKFDGSGFCFELDAGAHLGELLRALKESGMRETTCDKCGCPLLTRGDADRCPPCRTKELEKELEIYDDTHDGDTEPNAEGFPF